MTRLRKFKKQFDREHKVWSFVYQYGFILFAVYIISEFVLVPIYA